MTFLTKPMPWPGKQPCRIETKVHVTGNHRVVESWPASLERSASLAEAVEGHKVIKAKPGACFSLRAGELVRRQITWPAARSPFLGQGIKKAQGAAPFSQHQASPPDWLDLLMVMDAVGYSVHGLIDIHFESSRQLANCRC